MSLQYVVRGDQHIDDDATYQLSYPDLKATYERLSKLDDSSFKASMPEVLHFCCFVAWIKEIPSSVLLGDRGLIHLIAHHIHEGAEDDGPQAFKSLRHQFNTLMKLD
ncbi:hypothetical protein QE321_gp132 [Pseudomonas phage SPA01]|uniref:Uncharacterized protein n=4 Tax=Pakpunavirus TaxID=1921407 RepID=A0A9Y1QZS5_9CAUD|nr:hypothetical protein QE321_gp132 [Pseudomonas phage SPA01]YP_010762757.1 hypothetical protein QE326_gp082 [Pseudomonas phage PaZq-1]YP_010763680.1 hypothetical protein QE331_gp156 [Pseudomonas phage 20Sep416]QAY01697.1 hypothetical protein PaSzw1_141 [Pseudomonas phage PaSzW-1]QAX99826.1 hypothetical protein [Pseudomonas phage PaZq-1]WFG37651.1 hypothetical protein 20Sep416_00171 [Pseudomonas phage 20Sep416]WFG74127.1 hypothetical protein DOEKDBNA_00086 [Pseudomonas phage SPA01]